MKEQTWRNPWNLTGAVTQPLQRDGGNFEILVLPQWLSIQFFLGYFHLSLLFLIFSNVTQNNRSNLLLAMTESNLPTTGEELEVKNEFPATGEEKQQGKIS